MTTTPATTPPSTTPPPSTTDSVAQSMVPSYRLREIREDRDQWRSKADTFQQEMAGLKQQIATLTEQAGQTTALEQQISTLKRHSAHRLHLTQLASNRPNLAHPSVQDLFISGYERSTAGMEQAPSFADWVATAEETADPLYAAHLKATAGPDPRLAQIATVLGAVDSGQMEPEAAAAAFLQSLTQQPNTADADPAQALLTLMRQVLSGDESTPINTLKGNTNGGTRSVTHTPKLYTATDLADVRSRNGGRLTQEVRQALRAQLANSQAIK